MYLGIGDHCLRLTLSFVSSLLVGRSLVALLDKLSARFLVCPPVCQSGFSLSMDTEKKQPEKSCPGGPKRKKTTTTSQQWQSTNEPSLELGKAYGLSFGKWLWRVNSWSPLKGVTAVGFCVGSRVCSMPTVVVAGVGAVAVAIIIRVD